MRNSTRTSLGLRPMTFHPHYLIHPEGSCLIQMGNTWVLCTASVEEKVPPFIETKGSGWVTAEYSMLPRATSTRTRRESSAGRPTGRSQEIQRLIGRSLRACIDLKALGERTITLDCDVLQADGSTRIASINGAFVALSLATQWLLKKGKITTSPIQSSVAGVSVGILKGEILLDLDYAEDSTCDVDMNVVMLKDGRLIEIQATSERNPFSLSVAQDMLQQATKAIQWITDLQTQALKGHE